MDVFPSARCEGTMWRSLLFQALTSVCVVVGVISRETHTACKKTDSTQARIPLNCSSNQMIHVISEQFGERTSEDNCSVVSTISATKSFTSDSNGLIVNCNGHETCTEYTVCSPLQGCNFSRPAVEIMYECVTASKDICSEYYETGSLTSLYVHSPGYPNSVGVNHSCVCRVTGSALELMVIHRRITKGVVQINVTGDETETWTSSINRFNRIITNNAREIIVVYVNGGNDNQQFWTRIRGNMNKAECYMYQMRTSSAVNTQETTGNTVSHSESTPNPSQPGSSVSETVTELASKSSVEGYVSSTETSNENHDSSTEADNSTVVVSAVCGVIIFLLIIIIILQFLYFKVMKPRRIKREASQSTGTDTVIQDGHSGSSDANHMYSGLSNYQNMEDGNTYGRVHIYENTST